VTDDLLDLLWDLLDEILPSLPGAPHKVCEKYEGDEKIVCEFCMLGWDLMGLVIKRACDPLPQPLRRCCVKLLDKAAEEICQDYTEWDPGLVDPGFKEYCADAKLEGDAECGKCCDDYLEEFCQDMPDKQRGYTQNACTRWCGRPETK
jgi:hypothetical protein